MYYKLLVIAICSVFIGCSISQKKKKENSKQQKQINKKDSIKAFEVEGRPYYYDEPKAIDEQKLELKTTNNNK